MDLFSGVAVALVTPFNSSGELDVKRLQQLIDWQLHEGTETFLLNSMIGEAASLLPEELQEIMTAAVMTVKQRANIIVAVNDSNVVSAVEGIVNAEVSGVNGILLTVPNRYQSDALGVQKYLDYVVQHTNMPLLLHIDGSQLSYDADASIFLPIMQQPQVAGISFSGIGLDTIQQFVHLLPTDCNFYTGDEALMLPLMALGFSGLFSSVANLYPKAVGQLVSLAARGQYAELRQQQAAMAAVNQALGSAAGIKAALNSTGITVGDVRLPLSKKTVAATQQIRHLLTEIEANEQFLTD